MMTMKSWMVMGVAAALMVGCAASQAAEEGTSSTVSVQASGTVIPAAGEQRKRVDGVRTDLTGMTDEQIRLYADTVIRSGHPFIYTGGIANRPIVDQADLPLAQNMNVASVGCTGGFIEAGKFNQHIIEWLKTRQQGAPPHDPTAADGY